MIKNLNQQQTALTHLIEEDNKVHPAKASYTTNPFSLKLDLKSAFVKLISLSDSLSNRPLAKDK